MPKSLAMASRKARFLPPGGAQALMLNPSAGQGQGRTVDRTSLDAFVRDHLATVLMKMKPRDDLAADVWCLADDANRTVLLYSLAGDSIRLRHPYRGEGLWFDPRTGATHSAEITGTEIRKPTSEAWLLLLTVQ